MKRLSKQSLMINAVGVITENHLHVTYEINSTKQKGKVGGGVKWN